MGDTGCKDELEGAILDIDLLEEEDEMINVYYRDSKSIYLYAWMEQDSADKITMGVESLPVGLHLYESKKCARVVCLNMVEPVCMQVAVDVKNFTDDFVYDVFSEDCRLHKVKLKLTEAEYKAKSGLYREYDTKNKLIYYTLQNIKRAISITHEP